MVAPFPSHPRRFLPADLVVDRYEVVEPFFDELESREVSGPEAAVRWLEDQSELAAALSEARTARYTAMSCHTDDPEKAAAYGAWIEQVDPRCQPRWQALRTRFVDLGLDESLPERFAVLTRSLRSEVELFREENVPLQTQDQKLDQRYGQISGAMTVDFEGEERTLPQMARFLEEPDRARREAAWRATAERRGRDRDELDSLFDQMLDLRHRIARNAGHEDFLSYQFEAYQRFDYTPADCEDFHRAIEAVVVPARRELQEQRRRRLGVETLRPWDLSVDPDGAAPLRPFQDTEELCAGCSQVFGKLDPELGQQFDRMRKEGWLDLDSRKGKAPGGYQASFDEGRHPFIFMNAAGMHSDVTTLLHEGGHAFHALACRDDSMVQYRHAPIEFAEVASMSMEMLALEHYGVFYDGDELRRARIEQLERVLDLFPSVATIDAFQHWIYRNPGHDRAARAAKWLELGDRFGGIEDWSGLEELREYQWQRVLHLYSVPLYYVEYGISQIGALQTWVRARQDAAKAIADYRAGLALGGSRPLPELWGAAGLSFDFKEASLRPLIEAVMEERASLVGSA